MPDKSLDYLQGRIEALAYDAQYWRSKLLPWEEEDHEIPNDLRGHLHKAKSELDAAWAEYDAAINRPTRRNAEKGE